MTHDTWWGVNILSKCQLPNSYGLGVMMFWRFGGKGSLNYRMQDAGYRKKGFRKIRRSSRKQNMEKLKIIEGFVGNSRRSCRKKRRSCRTHFLHISFYLVSATAEIVLDVSIFPSQSKKHGLLETKTDWSVFEPQYMLYRPNIRG